MRDRQTNARRWRDSWLDGRAVLVTQRSVDPDCAGHGCARLFGWRSWTDRRCWSGAGRRGGFYCAGRLGGFYCAGRRGGFSCRRRVSRFFAVKLPKFVLGAKWVCGTRPRRTRSQFSLFQCHLFFLKLTERFKRHLVSFRALPNSFLHCT